MASSSVPKLQLILTLQLLLSSCQSPPPQPEGYPRVLDDRLSIELIAENPEAMTPIGLTIDDQDAIYFLESHTHTPLSDYAGPKYDRIKKGVDQNADGRPESWIIFADSIEDGMNLAIGPDQGIYLTHKNKVTVFFDQDQDGVSDSRKTLLQLTSSGEVYDHAAVMGIAFSPDGWMYISRGNCGGLAWKITGTDSSFIEGYGDGGNVFRCKPDGSRVEEIATGFWNPFDITFSLEGRLMLVDNDPDSRGPNRLLEIVPGGDYGYKSLYGGSGIHPYLAWNGELPGTLPYAAALGEAPSGVIDAGLASFPADYQGNMLATVWEEHTIVRIPLQDWKSSVRGEAEIIVQGDSLFHPVAMATNSRGDVYLTDWVVRQYPNHGKGRIWRISAEGNRPPQRALNHTLPFLRENSWSEEQIMNALASDDPFRMAVARKELSRPQYKDLLVSHLSDPQAEIKLQALLAAFHSKEPISPALLSKLANDENPNIRRMTLIYIGRNTRTEMLREVEKALHESNITPDLFETWLATVKHLQPAFVTGYALQKEKTAKNLPRQLPADYLLRIIADADLSDEIRAAALPYLENPSEYPQALLPLADQPSEILKEAFLQTIKKIPHPEMARKALSMAENPDFSPDIRALAMVSLSLQPTRFCEEISPLTEAENPLIATAARRYICNCPGSNTACQKRKEGLPQTDQDWNAAVNGKGNSAIGKLIFQDMATQCQNCHKVNGWGGNYGPDLTHIGSSKTREQLINAILQPSLEISPEWQGWFVKDQDGNTHYGRQIDVGFKNVELLDANGEFITYQEPQSYGLAENSLMPEGLENLLTGEEFNHLIAYLSSLK